MRPFYFALLALPLAGCLEMPPPVVTDYNGASVKVISYAMGSTAPTEEAAAEALRICKAGGKRRAEYASTRILPDYRPEHLYLCL